MIAGTKSDPLRVGIGGPVGSGKTALMDWLCKRMRGRFEIAAITNDIYTREDAEFLTRSGALPPERIRGVETGGCPHTAIREDASINLAAVAEMTRLFPRLDLILIEFGRRQSGRDLFAGACRSDDLRHRRCRRRQNSAQGRARHHPLRSAGDQQDRPRAVGRRQSRDHGPRCKANARLPPVCLHQSQIGSRSQGDHRFRRHQGRALIRPNWAHLPLFCRTCETDHMRRRRIAIEMVKAGANSPAQPFQGSRKWQTTSLRARGEAASSYSR